MQNEEAVAVESTTIRQVVLEFVFLGVAAVFIAFFMKKTPLISALICVNIIARFILIGRKYDWVFFLIGFVLGGGNDLVSMLTHVYRYTPPQILHMPIPFWMLVFWGQILVAFRQLFQLPVFQGPPVKGNPWRIDFRLIADITTFIALRIIIYNFVRHEPAATHHHPTREARMAADSGGRGARPLLRGGAHRVRAIRILRPCFPGNAGLVDDLLGLHDTHSRQGAIRPHRDVPGGQELEEANPNRGGYE
jgi:hypothetical protein